MTAAKANTLRVDRMRGEPSKAERKAKKSEKPATKECKWTLFKLWELYQEINPDKKGQISDDGRFKKYLLKPFGNKSVVEITTLDIDRMRNRLLKTLAPATVMKILELMRRLFNFGKKQGLLSIPGNLHFNMPRVDNEKTEVFTDEQQNNFWKTIDECKDPFIASYMIFVAYSGVRRSAAIALRWEDCDCAKGFITLRGASAKSGKTKIIPMNRTVKDLLQSIPHDNGEFVFPQWHKDTYTKYARKLLDQAGLPKDFRPIHGLRHNFASHLASSGKVDLYTLQNLLTHSSSAMTQRYAHLANEALQRASMVANEVLMPKTR